jgi:serine O-acetyltransferase
LFENVREDLHYACLGNQHELGVAPLLRELMSPGTQAILVHRMGHWCDKIRFPPVRFILRVIHFLVQYLMSWRIGIFIPIKAEIGPGFVIHTWGGGCFLPEAKIGRRLTIIGGGVQMDYKVPEIGDNVWIGPGTKVIGKVRIGNRVRTAPNSVVQTDVPDDCVVFGNPGRVIGPVPRPTGAQGKARIVPAGMIRKRPPSPSEGA